MVGVREEEWENWWGEGGRMGGEREGEWVEEDMPTIIIIMLIVIEINISNKQRRGGRGA
jgi:hypothetical protein